MKISAHDKWLLAALIAAVAACSSSDSLRSSPSAAASSRTAAIASNIACVYSQGYWKTHASAWPMKTSITLGNASYQVADAETLLNTPVGGDSSLDLAHQLIAAKLNAVIDGTAVPASVASAIAAADSWITATAAQLKLATLPFDVKDQTATSLAAQLESYNTGFAGLAECDSTPISPTGGTCADFGPAAGKNVFVSGTYTGSKSDVEGSVVAGGSVTIDNYSIGAALDQTTNPIALITDGTLQLTSGQINGQVWLPGTPVLDHGTITGAVYQLGDGTGGTVTFPFQTATATLQNLSSYVATLTDSTAQVKNQYGTLVLTSTSSAGYSVFTLDSATFAKAQGVEIHAPADQMVVFNVTGTTAAFPPVGFLTVNSTENVILWNFPAATSLTIGAVGVPGTILAPLAAVKSDNDQVRGSIFAASFSGTGQTNNFPFTGCLPAQ